MRLDSILFVSLSIAPIFKLTVGKHENYRVLCNFLHGEDIIFHYDNIQDEEKYT